MKTGKCFLWWAVFIIIITLCSCSGYDDNSASDSDKTLQDGSSVGDLDDNEQGDDGPFHYTEPCPSGPEFSFKLWSDKLNVPYPNNLYTIYDPESPTGRRVLIDKNVTLPMSRIVKLDFIFGSLTEAVNESNGFSTLADLYIPVEWAPNPLSFPRYWETGTKDSFFLMLSDTASKDRGKIIPVQAEYMDKFIRVVPMETLEQNTRYILVVTRSLRPDQGQCYRASNSMISVWDEFKNGDGGLYKSAFNLLEKNI